MTDTSVIIINVTTLKVPIVSKSVKKINLRYNVTKKLKIEK